MMKSLTTDTEWLKESGILFGSAISMWKKSTVASGQTISKILLESLFGEEKNRNQIEYNNWIYKNIPFEQINNCCPVDLSGFYSKVLNTAKPNALHRRLAYLAETRKINALITTNYDCGVELCLSQKSTVNVFYDPKEYDPSKVPLFKLHGTAEVPNSIIYRLSQESKLPDDKKELLIKIIQNRPLIIIGYSGIDFEVCPSIIEGKPSEVIWFVRDNDNENDEGDTIGYKYISKSIKVYRYKWDLRNGFPWSPIPAKGRLEKGDDFALRIQALLKKYIVSEKNMKLWAIRLSNTIGDSINAKKVLELSTQYQNDPNFLYEKARLNFNTGKYINANRYYKELYWYYRKRKEYINAYKTIIYGKSESLYCCGKFISCFISILIGYFQCRKRSEVHSSFRFWIQQKIVRFGLDLIEIFPKTIKKKLGNKLMNRFDAVIDYYAESGDVIGNYSAKDYQSEIFENKPYIEGYKHLGAIINYSRSYRRSLPDSLHFSDFTKELSNIFDLVKSIGCNPEIWKLSFMLQLLNSKKQRIEKRRWRILKRKYQKLCQYTWTGKCFSEYLVRKHCRKLLKHFSNDRT